MAPVASIERLWRSLGASPGASSLWMAPPAVGTNATPLDAIGPLMNTSSSDPSLGDIYHAGVPPLEIVFPGNLLTELAIVFADGDARRIETMA